MKRVLIGGIGNVLLGDDGVGPYLVRLLEAAYSFQYQVDIVDLGTPALDLVYKIVDLDVLILVDAVRNDDPHGTIRLYDKGDLLWHAPPTRMDPHSPALTESLLAADMLGRSPSTVMLVAVTGRRYETGCDLSEPVLSSVPRAIQAILNALDRAGIAYTRRRAVPDIWWTSGVTPASLLPEPDITAPAR